MDHNNLVHIIIQLTKDKKGFPPVDSERVWAEPMGEEKYKIKNIPFFARGISDGDVVGVKEHGGNLFYDKTLKYSGNSTIHMIFFSDVSKKEIGETMQDLGKLGVEWEGNKDNYYSLNVPKEVEYQPIIEYLKRKSKILDYEESSLAHT